MNKYEEENLERILYEIEELEKKEPDMPEEKKAYYLYHELGNIYMYKVNYALTIASNEEEYKKKLSIYNEGTNKYGEAICIDMNGTFVEGLRRLGIEAHLSYTDSLEENPLTHADVSFKCKNENWYFANLTSDIMHIKTGMKVRNFGLSQERLKKRLYDDDIRYDRLDHLYNMNKENEGKKFTEIEEEQLKNWDNEFGYTYKGLYTNDVIDMMAKETQDDNFMKEFFGTSKKDELVQRKIEFVMDKIGIINIHRNKRIGDVESLEYYTKIAYKLFSREEIEKYLDVCTAFEEVNGKRVGRNILIIKKDNENVYYLYNSQTQIFEKIDKEELLKLPIKQYNRIERKIDKISDVINYYEGRLKTKEIDER